MSKRKIVNKFRMQTHAFILNSRPLNEYDRDYTLLTADLGVIQAFARSVRKAGAKLGGHLEPPNIAWVELVESQRGWQITSALEESPQREILVSAPALRAVLQAGWVLSEFVPVSYPDNELWALWEQFIQQLSDSENFVPAITRGVLAQFLIKLLHQLGFFPDPGDIDAISSRLRVNLDKILAGEWLTGYNGRDSGLWEVAKSAVKTAKELT